MDEERIDVGVEDFSLDELLMKAAELQEEDGIDWTGWLSAKQWAGVWKVSRAKAMQSIQQLLRAGMMDVSERSGRNVIGRRFVLPVYRLVLDKESDKIKERTEDGNG